VLANILEELMQIVGPQHQSQQKQIEDEKNKTSSGIYEQVFKNAVVKDTTDANGGFNLNYNEEIEVKSAEFKINNEGFYLNKMESMIIH
jgi:hypothetical protein